MSLSVIREGGRQTIVTGRGRRRTANTQGGVGEVVSTNADD